MRFVALLTIAVCYAALPPRSHQTPGEAALELFEDADGNDDGELHLLEMVDYFDRYDADGNKRVTKAEYLNYTRVHAPDLVDQGSILFDVFDHDGDGRVQLDDYMHLYLDMVPDVDTDIVSNYTFIGYFSVGLSSLTSTSTGDTYFQPISLAALIKIEPMTFSKGNIPFSHSRVYNGNIKLIAVNNSNLRMTIVYNATVRLTSVLNGRTQRQHHTVSSLKRQHYADSSLQRQDYDVSSLHRQHYAVSCLHWRHQSTTANS